MPDLPVVGDAPSKAVGGAGHAAGGAAGFLTKRIGPLPVWGYAAGIGVAFLALKYVSGKGGAGIGGVGASPIAAPTPSPVAVSPGAATGAGSLAAPTLPPPPPVINIIVPGASQPNGATGAQDSSGGGVTVHVTTPAAVTTSSGVGSKPLTAAAFTQQTGIALSGKGAHAGFDPGVVPAGYTGPKATASSAATSGDPQGHPWASQWGGVGAGPFVPGGTAAPSAPTVRTSGSQPD